MDDIVKSIIEVIADIAEIPMNKINGESLVIDDLKLSSLQIMIILSELERIYSIEFSEKDLSSIKTVNDLANVIIDR